MICMKLWRVRGRGVLDFLLGGLNSSANIFIEFECRAYVTIFENSEKIFGRPRDDQSY